ncbi:MAG: hypothetical protein PHG02_03300 [Oscillospiraceae bacterium]|nr:hypothetical protein [Oscillospiraceae bacterium]
MTVQNFKTLKFSFTPEECGTADGEMTVIFAPDTADPEMGNYFAEYFFGRGEYTLLNHVAGVWYTAQTDEEAANMIQEDVLSILQESDCVKYYNSDLMSLEAIDDAEDGAMWAQLEAGEADGRDD